MTDEKLVNEMKREIDSWRANFLNDKFTGSFKRIPENYKNRLSAYFLSIPSESFTGAQREWENCISALLQSFGENS